METLRFKTWNEFHDFVDKDRQLFPTYWRGQVDPTWPLASSFEREILNLNGGAKPTSSKIFPYDGRYKPDGKNKFWRPGFYQATRDGYLAKFKKACSGLRGPNPKELKDDEWWALGRHYGLITPLLDWTEKPYIAAFFALTDLFSSMYRIDTGLVFEGKDIAIYRLFDNGELQGDGLSIVSPVVEELGRMQSQRSIFTWLDSEEYFELQGVLDNTNRGNLLTQILLSDQSLCDGLRDLRNHGIDYRLLFPDLVGAAMEANTKISELL